MLEQSKPGAVINRDILIAYGMSQVDLARASGLSKVRIHLLVSGKAPITPEVALRLAKLTSTDPLYWMQLQMNYDLAVTAQKLGDILEDLEPLSHFEDANMGKGWSIEGLQTALKRPDAANPDDDAGDGLGYCYDLAGHSA
jgi:addiction module HigA family antidote